MNVSGLMKFLVAQNHMSTTQAANGIMACIEEIHLLAAEPAASAFGFPRRNHHVFPQY